MAPEQLSLASTTTPLGAVYTPGDLSEFVLDQARDEVGGLPKGRWLDPACGDGAFLVLMVRELAREVSPSELPRLVVERVHGIDVDPVACAAAAKRVRTEVERIAGPQAGDYFNANVFCADALAADGLGEFGLVIGNPPYVSAMSLNADDKTRFLERFATAWGRLDTYALFVELGLQLLAPGGRLTFITPDKLLTAISCRPLRARIAEDFAVESIARFDRHDLFPRVATVPCVTSIARCAPRPTAPAQWWDRAPEGFVPVDAATSVPIRDDGSPWQPTERSSSNMLELGDIADRVSVGIATGLNGCFVMSAELAAREGIDPAFLRTAIRGRDIKPGTVLDSGLRLVMPFEFRGGQPALVDLDEHPTLRTYLERFRNELENRHCVRVWNKEWYDLHDPVTCDIAALPKVVLPDVAKNPRFAPDVGTLAPLHSAYFIVPAPDSGWTPELLSAALNTDEVTSHLRRTAPTAKSGYRRFRAEVLRRVPLPRTVPFADTVADAA